jgi:hypothetical protein
VVQHHIDKEMCTVFVALPLFCPSLYLQLKTMVVHAHMPALSLWIASYATSYMTYENGVDAVASVGKCTGADTVNSFCNKNTFFSLF